MVGADHVISKAQGSTYTGYVTSKHEPVWNLFEHNLKKIYTWVIVDTMSILSWTFSIIHSIIIKCCGGKTLAMWYDPVQPELGYSIHKNN